LLAASRSRANVTLSAIAYIEVIGKLEEDKKEIYNNLENVIHKCTSYLSEFNKNFRTQYDNIFLECGFEPRWNHQDNKLLPELDGKNFYVPNEFNNFYVSREMSKISDITIFLHIHPGDIDKGEDEVLDMLLLSKTKYKKLANSLENDKELFTRWKKRTVI
jgi:hypothetical protein